VIDEIGALLGPLLGTLERVGWVQRHLHPPLARRLADEIAPCAEAVAAPLAVLEASEWPPSIAFLRERVLDSGRQTVELVTAFVEAARTPDDPIGLFRALRRFPRVQETLYPLSMAFEPVSRWFLDPAHRDDVALLERLRAGALRRDDVRVGVMHAANERDARGGFSVYVPEWWDGTTAMPLVVALHGGSGHGRDSLWHWLRDVRARGVLLAAPTSADRTWSLMGPDRDAERLRAMVDSLASRYPVDRSRVLLTGMSDGGTYALLYGIREGAPFTHLAALCGVLHPMLMASGDLARAKDRPIYLVHGALDWMFPVATARLAREALEHAGARLVYREIEDLSHTYPRDENPRILSWLAGPERPPDPPAPAAE
jgi:phospholipase/carboxylesterase